MSGEGSLRTLRAWHGYLSAFAFLILIFFAVTGILLNHPTLSQARPPILTQAYVDLTPGQVQLLRTSPEYGPELYKIAAARLRLEGGLVNAQRDGDDVLIRLQGIRGGSLIQADLAKAKVDISVDRQYFLAVIGELHRTERAGTAWQVFVDLAGVLLIAVALLGYGLFLTLRYRLRTALALTGASALVMAILIIALVQ